MNASKSILACEIARTRHQRLLAARRFVDRDCCDAVSGGIRRLGNSDRPPIAAASSPASSSAPSATVYLGLLQPGQQILRRDGDLFPLRRQAFRGSGKTAGDCARMCVHGGAAFALVDGDKTYLLDGD